MQKRRPVVQITELFYHSTRNLRSNRYSFSNQKKDPIEITIEDSDNEQEKNIDFLNQDSYNQILFKYPFQDPLAIQITYLKVLSNSTGDRFRTRPGEFLNDVIIEWYLK